MHRSLYEFELQSSHKIVVQVTKENLNKYKSLSKGGLLYAFEVLHKIQDKYKKKTQEILRKEEKAL